MKNIIIGTAGHVDHGKTMLIKALTGIDTDRLKEEKKRGITIELGFAYFDLEDGSRAGIIDVPGHEKFIKNMLAGAGGIDLALLIVAADDGVMPQTREHLGILSLLDIKEGVIALTKTDLVDKDWLELVTEDVRALTKGTFLESADIIPVSAFTGDGIPELRQKINALSKRAGEKNIARPFRVPVDRVFTMEGFGTVITGTLIEGTLAEGDEVTVYPKGLSARVRNLQVHSKGVEKAYAGQRVAVNLAGVKKEELEKGDTLAKPQSMENTMMLDISLTILPDSSRIIQNGTRLHFYHGARETLCKLVLLEHESLSPGQSGYAQLRFFEEVAAKKGDRFVLRFYSPLETVGGGVILDPNPKKHRRGAQGVLQSLKVREKGSGEETLYQAITDGAVTFTPLADIRARLLLDDQAFESALQLLIEREQIFLLDAKHAVSLDSISKVGQTACDALKEYHMQNPLQPGMRVDELRTRILKGRDGVLADKLIALLNQRGLIKIQDRKASLPGFAITYSEKDQKLANEIEGMYKSGGFSPPELDQVYGQFAKDKAGAKQIIDAMLGDGRLVLASPQLCFHADVVQEARRIIESETQEKGQFTLADFRDKAGTSRKYALALLEYFDRTGQTKKVGDARIFNG